MGLPQAVLNKRQTLYIVTFLLFPVNVLEGLLAATWRVGISALYNIVHFCWLDVSLLGHGVEVFDPGYHTYCYYLKIEVTQSHVAMKAFCFLLLQLHNCEVRNALQQRDADEGVKLIKTKNSSSKASKWKQSRIRWCLAYTLLNNPSLLPYRKGALLDSPNGVQIRPGMP